MSIKPFTGGELNILNGKMGISAPNNSVPVSRLVRYHKPKSASELELLISNHVNNKKCPCGVVSKGTIKDFGRNLYNAQKEFWGEYKYSLKECIQWEYDLFILQMLKGEMMENKCKRELINMLSNHFEVKEANHFIDEELRVDLEVLYNQKVVCGIQVKPDSFKRVRNEVVNFNHEANKNYNKPVFYIYYNYDTETFSNMEEIFKKIELTKF